MDATSIRPLTLEQVHSVQRVVRHYVPLTAVRKGPVGAAVGRHTEPILVLAEFDLIDARLFS